MSWWKAEKHFIACTLALVFNSINRVHKKRTESSDRSLYSKLHFVERPLKGDVQMDVADTLGG